MGGARGGRDGAGVTRRTGPHPLIAVLPALPLMAWVILFILVPMGTMAVFSFWRYHDFDLEPVWNLGNYRAVLTQPCTRASWGAPSRSPPW